MENSVVKVLAIDDNPDNLVSLKALILEAFPQATVFTALSGKDGLTVAAAEIPDVVLLDIVMPDIDGFEVCRHLKANSALQDIPVVFVTAIKEDRASRIMALESGAEAFLAKPVDETELTAQIRAMLKIRRANQAKMNEQDRLASLVAAKTSELESAYHLALNLLAQRKAAEDNLIYLSYHDQLTGLYNRRFFEEELRRLDTDRNLPLTIVMGDVNGLKMINDSFGHVVGDDLLRKVSCVIKNGCRADDIVARLGGDEFIIILPKTDGLAAEQLIERLGCLLSKESVESVSLSVSFGCATKTSKDVNIQEIFVNAENHMYRHKVYQSSSMRSTTIDIVMNALFEKSGRELQHSKRVSSLCEAIAIEMQMDNDTVRQVKTAGLVHDIGKIGIGENILNKPGRLNDEEWREMRKHPESGWRILVSASEFSELADFVLEHHERWDGKGYPKGLKGSEIALESRIITLADSYDAMTSTRSYQKGMSMDEAKTEIIRCMGQQFDPDIAKVFVEKVLIVDNGELDSYSSSAADVQFFR